MIRILRRRERAEPASNERESVALLTRPRLASDVLVHEPLDAGAPWVVQRGSQQYIRVGADLARLLRAMDGERGYAGLVETLGPPWNEREVGRAVENLREKGLLDNGKRPRSSGAWFKFVPPLTFQLTLLKPQRLLNALMPLIGRLANRAAAVVAAVLALGGLLALLAQGPSLVRALGEPLPLAVLLGVAAASTVTTALHEIGHGAVLTYYGGRPSRMGVMLFYLTPAFFCDVSDGWRLPHREQRVRVALAGIVTQTVVAGTAGCAALVLNLTGGAPALRDGMTVFAVSTYVTGVLNLLPFVKLDGYIALMSHLDASHLRDRAMTDARRLVAKVLFGGTYGRELPTLSWAPAFGLACMVFPLYLIGLAFNLWLDFLTGLGVIGASAVFMALVYLAYRAWQGGTLLVREARTGGARPWRMVLTGLAAAGGLGAALTFVPVSYTVTGGFVYEDGRARLVLSDAADREAVREGATVTLQRRGLVTRTDLATGTIGRGDAEAGTAPLSAFLPVREGDELPIPALGMPLVLRGDPGENVGVARVTAGERPLGEWLYLSYIAPVRR